MSATSGRYEYAVRWTEIDATGKPCYDDFSEWSCGCPKTWTRPDDAAAHAKDLREEAMDFMSDIVVVRRWVSGWKPAVDGTWGAPVAHIWAWPDTDPAANADNQSEETS